MSGGAEASREVAGDPAGDPAGRLAATLDLDLLSTAELLRRIHGEDARVAGAVAAESAALAAAVDAVAARLAAGGRLFYVGAGTSARIAALDAAELPPTYGTPPALVQVIVAGGERALLHAVEGAEDDEEAGRCEVLERVRAGDALVGIAASGTTPFTVAAVEEARELGAVTVAVTARPGSPLAAAAEHAIAPRTGAEVVMGSTRMKAGTAQKLVLNALSTAVMVRLGRVHSNLMVEMPATNAKLRARAARMVELAAEVSAEQAATALAAADGDVKVAVVVARGRSVEEARAALAAAGGNLRRALAGGEAAR
ncbi:MAG TPA: N-acetylmuramic acid 6-phosphate etherase [Thermoanaerobaculia bacterium]|jgi:N-acetylmuramic acid 6-phosphate etherase|nr:N-acetylmuramic acid 6-phosphate etherase [Thermoanaerobaculia bacterium]